VIGINLALNVFTFASKAWLLTGRVLVPDRGELTSSMPELAISTRNFDQVVRITISGGISRMG
jgi:hypothetical protein